MEQESERMTIGIEYEYTEDYSKLLDLMDELVS